MRTVSKETFKAFSERAIEAVAQDKRIPPLVFLPRTYRHQPFRLTADNLCLRVDPPTIQDNLASIAAADPVGMCIAIMQGQPIPAFHVTEDGEIEISYMTPDFDSRKEMAKFLALKVTPVWLQNKNGGRAQGAKKDEKTWEALMETRAGKDALEKVAGRDPQTGEFVEE